MLDMHDRDTAYHALVGVSAMGVNPSGSTAPNCADSGLTRVVPGDPDASLLMMKIEGNPPCGTAMPPGGKLSDDQIMRIRSWIQNGANDD
jgi:hypothetical protein